MLFYIIRYNHANLCNYAISEGSCIHPLTDRSNLACECIPMAYPCLPNIIWISLQCYYWGSKKPQIWRYFQLQHSAVAPCSSIDIKLNADVLLQTFPYSMVSRSFMTSNTLTPYWQCGIHKLCHSKCNGPVKAWHTQHQTFLPTLTGMQSPIPTKLSIVKEHICTILAPKSLGCDVQIDH